MIGREVRGEVPHERVERLRAEELNSILPLIGADETGIGNDLKSSRLERLVQLP